MREVHFRIRFTTHCLGNVRIGRGPHMYYAMPRNRNSERVQFSQSWWHAILAQAAAAANCPPARVREILFSLEIDGAPSSRRYRRYYEPSRFTWHEAYYPGDEVGVSCLTPAEVTDEMLWRLLSTAGRYYGISPKHPGEHGRFEVTSVQTVSQLAAEKIKAADG